MKVKAVEFLNPEKSAHIVVPEYLKQIYLDLNYHLLSKNALLKKITIFINIKILRKFRIIFNFFWNQKFNLGEPSQHDIIVFDDVSFRTLNNIFSKQNYFVLPTRVERIKEVYLSKKILLYMLRNFFKRSLKQNYLCSLIEIIRPKNIVTFIDNSLKKLMQSKSNSITSIVDVGANHPYRMKIIKNNKLYNFVNQGFENMKPRQKLKKIYIRNGSIYASTRETIMKKNSLVSKKNLPYVMSKERSINIDSFDDLILAKHYLKKK